MSSNRRQLHVKVEPPEHQVAYLRAPRPRPRVVSLTHRKPHVEILQTCKQIEQEATPILYGRNDFVVGLRLRATQSHRMDPFIQYLRSSTLLQLRLVTFRPGCCCDQWLKSLSSGRNVASVISRMQLIEQRDHQQVFWDIETALWQSAYPPFAQDNLRMLTLSGYRCCGQEQSLCLLPYHYWGADVHINHTQYIRRGWPSHHTGVKNLMSRNGVVICL